MKTSSLILMVCLLAGCVNAGEQAQKKTYAEHDQQQRDAAAQDAAYKEECRRRDEEQTKAREDRQQKAQAQWAAFVVRRDAAAKDPQTADVLDIVNNPKSFEGIATTVHATWLGFNPDLESTGYENLVDMAVAPRLKARPALNVLLERQELTQRRDFYAGIKNSQVDATLYVEGGQAYVVSVRAR